MNKKVKNAKNTTYNGIKYRSTLEVTIKKTLNSLKIPSSYETLTFILSPEIKPNTRFYNRTKKKGFHLRNEKIPKITYTPDFIIKNGGMTIIIEAKGFETDSYKIKRNLFRKLINNRDDIVVFEVKSKNDLIEGLKKEKLI